MKCEMVVSVSMEGTEMIECSSEGKLRRCDIIACDECVAKIAAHDPELAKEYEESCGSY